MKKNIKKILFLVISLSWIFAGQLVLAASYDLTNTGLEAAADQADLPGSGSADVPGLVGNRIITPLMSLVGVIFLCLMIYAGFIWMTARGDSTKVKTATGLIFDAVIGLVVVLGAYAITYFVISNVGG